MQQLQKQLTGRERREIVCVKCIHQDWLKAAQTSASLEVEARPGVLPAACCHPAYSYARWICVQQQRSSQRRFSGWVAWQGGMGWVGIEEDKPVMFLNCGTEAASDFLLGLKLTEPLSVLSHAHTEGKSHRCLVHQALPGTAGSILPLPWCSHSLPQGWGGGSWKPQQTRGCSRCRQKEAALWHKQHEAVASGGNCLGVRNLLIVFTQKQAQVAEPLLSSWALSCLSSIPQSTCHWCTTLH